MKTIGEKLRDLRDAFGLTQKEFANKIGITRASINGYENNINPLTQAIKWKIFQATGIGLEYFDTDMSLMEALEKFDLNPAKLEFRDIQERVCVFYDGIKNFKENKCLETPFKQDSWVLKHLFDKELDKFNLCLIKAKGNEALPYAENGKILIVAKDKELSNYDTIIIEYNGKLMIVEYFEAFNKIILTLNKKNKTISIDEFKEKIKVFGVIMAINSTKLLFDRNL